MSLWLVKSLLPIRLALAFLLGLLPAGWSRNVPLDFALYFYISHSNLCKVCFGSHVSVGWFRTPLWTVSKDGSNSHHNKEVVLGAYFRGCPKGFPTSQPRLLSAPRICSSGEIVELEDLSLSSRWHQLHAKSELGGFARLTLAKDGLVFGCVFVVVQNRGEPQPT